MPQVMHGKRAVIDTLPAKGERPPVIYRYAGDRFLLLEYGEMVLDLTMNFRIFGLNDALKKAALDGLIETVPALRSMLIQYDSLRLPTRRLVDTLKQLEDTIPIFDLQQRNPAFRDNPILLKPADRIPWVRRTDEELQ